MSQSDANYNLVAGDYVLTVHGVNTGDYSFKIKDIAQAESMTVGSVIEGQLIPENSTKLYKFSAKAGDKYYFDQQDQTPFSWRLLDPYGRTVDDFSYPNSDVEALPLKYTGDYTLLISEYYYMVSQLV